MQLRGSQRAYEIVQEIRVAVGFGEVPAVAPAESSSRAERLRQPQDAIIGKQEELNLAAASSKQLAELRRINEDFVSLAKESKTSWQGTQTA